MQASGTVSLFQHLERGLAFGSHRLWNYNRTAVFQTEAQRPGLVRVFIPLPWWSGEGGFTFYSLSLHTLC